MKYSFYNDYSEGAHSSILELLSGTNVAQEAGYGEDSYALQAKDLMRKHLKNTEADIHFVSGGTQANLIALASMLEPYESVIAAETGHISVHEAGAIEATGHKINTVASTDGKLTIESLDSVLLTHTHEHMVMPRVVFISQSTELGTIYSKKELETLSDYCKKHGLYLYLDGARIGSALMSQDADFTLEDIGRLTDMFYIGGTKNGALLGEAIVILHPDLKKNFRFHLKQRGALLAKGRVLSLQFLALFTNNLFFDLAKHANTMAEKLTQGIEQRGYTFLTRSQSNQIFPILPNALIAELSQKYGFYIWSKVDETHSAIRLVTTWVTPAESVAVFLDDLKLLQNK